LQKSFILITVFKAGEYPTTETGEVHRPLNYQGFGDAGHDRILKDD
jgi:hypothetical protein